MKKYYGRAIDEVLTSGYDLAAVCFNSQQLWLPAQDPAHQYATHTQGKKKNTLPTYLQKTLIELRES